MAVADREPLPRLVELRGQAPEAAESSRPEARYWEAMSQENVELVRRIFDLWNGPGMSPAQRPDFFAPEVRFDLSGRKLNPAVYDGYEGLDRFTSEVGEVWDEFSIRLTELIDADPKVVSVMHATGRGRGSGIEIEGAMAWVWTLREGRVVRVDGDFEREQGLEAAGLEE